MQHVHHSSITMLNLKVNSSLQTWYNCTLNHNKTAMKPNNVQIATVATVHFQQSSWAKVKFSKKHSFWCGI